MSIILVIWETEMQRIAIQGQPRQEVPHTPFQPVSGNSGTASHPCCGRKPEIRGLQLRQPWAKSKTLSQKLLEKKRLQT
jgi:hypothetical protein